MDAVPLDWLRGVYDEWERGNFAAGADRLDADFRFTATDDFPEPAHDLDVDGVREFWRRFLGQWASVRIQADEIVPAGDRALVRVTQTGVGRTSGAETEMRYHFVWRFRDGRVQCLNIFMDEGEAHVEQLRGVYDAWARSEFDVGEDLFASDIEFGTTTGWPDAPTPGTGTPGLEQWRDLFLSSFQDLRVEAEELTGNGERVVVRVHQRGTFRATGIPIDVTYWHTWGFRGGAVVRFQPFEHEADARSAVGM
jgi:ketosteroid isomerase-like protein